VVAGELWADIGTLDPTAATMHNPRNVLSMQTRILLVYRSNCRQPEIS